LIEQDINERMADLAPSQNVGADPMLDRLKQERGMEVVPEVGMMPTIELPPVGTEDPVLDAIKQTRQRELSSSVYGATKVNPDQAAVAQKIGRETGVSGEFALRNLGELQRQARVREVERQNLWAKNPTLAKELSDPDFAAVAQDDVGTLAKIGEFFVELQQIRTQGWSPSMVRGVARARAMVERGKIGTEAQFGLATPQDIDRAERLAEDMSKLQGGGLIAATAEVVTQQIEQLKLTATTAAAGAAAGSVVPGLGTAAGGTLGFAAGTVMSTAAVEGGNAYLDMRRDGVSDDTAIPAAIAVGYLNGAIELAGLKLAASPFKALAKKAFAEATAQALAKPTVRAALATAGKEYVKQVGGEAAEEALQQTVSIIGDRIAKAAEGIEYQGTLESDFGQIIESFGQGALASSLLGGIGPGANLMVDLQSADSSIQTQRFFQNLSAAAKDDKLRARSPELFQRYLQSQAERVESDTIYVNGTIMQEAMTRSGLTIEQIAAADPELAQSIRQSLENGGDVTMPTARFATTLAGTEFGDSLIPHMRLDPDAKSGAEAAAIMRNRESTREEAVKILQEMQQRDESFVKSAQAVEDSIRSQVEQTGLGAEEARDSAMFLRDFYVVLASRMNMTPEQVYAMRRLQIRGEGMAEPIAPLEQADQFDQSGQRRTNTPQFRNYFGQSKVVDNQGQPLVVYHGTDSLNDYPEFVIGPTGEYGRGVYFTTATDRAGEYAGTNVGARIIPAYVSLQNPLVANKATFYTDVAAALGESRNEFMESAALASRHDGTKLEDFVTMRLKEIGHDGVIVNISGNEKFIVAFSPNQAKSVNNRGTWDRTSPILLEQAAKIDADYLAAVERGDMATAQRMVDEAAMGQGQEAVTRDEQGNVVPLSRRFDITSPKLFEQAAMSTRVPSAKGMEMAALNENLLADWETMKDNDKLIAGNLAKIKALNIPIKLDETKTPREQLEQFMDAVADNLDYLYQRMDPDLVERAKLWYVGARRIAEWLAARYGITDMQAAAMLAVLSPQKNWFENVSMADRIGDILTSARNERWSPDMEKNFRRMVEAVRAQVTITERQIAQNVEPTRPTEPLVAESDAAFKARKKEFDAKREEMKAAYEADLATWQAQLKEYETELEEKQEAGESTTMLRAEMAAHRRDRPKSPRMPGQQKAETEAQFAERVKQYEDDVVEWQKRTVRLEKMLDGKRKRLAYLDALSSSDRMNAMRNGTLNTVLATRDLELAAMFVRMFDEEHNDRSFAIITPEGGMAGPSMGASGPMSMRWGSYSTIQKAISVFEDGRAENVHHQIGKAHKVRNFYNNIFDPQNVNAATIDTHAIAAAFLSPLSASDEVVGWGLGAGVSDAKLGLHGGYPIIFEAYKRAAAKRGIIAREEQSITWEAIRGLFVAAEKKTLKPIIAEVWAKYMKGEITLEAARDQVFTLSKGIKTPEWVAQPSDLPVGSTYSGRSRELMDAMEPMIRRQMQEATRLMFEIAPDPRNTELTAAWNALTPEARFQISREVASKIIPRVLAEFGISGSFEEQVGGWDGATNMSFALTLPSTTMVRQVSKALRYVLSQESIFSISQEEFVGSERAGLVVIDLQPGTTPAEIADLYENKLYQVTKVGHSTVGSRMIIGLEAGVDSEELARRIDQAVGTDPRIVSIKHGEAWSLNDREPEPAVEGAAADQGRPARADERRRLDAIRGEASRLVNEQLGRYSQAAVGPARGFFDPRSLTATIAKGGDLSTLIHEAAHAFLTIYTQIAQQPDAPAQVKADIDELLKWFGIAGATPEARLESWLGMTVEQQRKYHEQFAYSFEIYAWDGKAPSAELRGLFSRFRSYLTRVYKSIRDDLNTIYRREFGRDLPILTNEVRQVMDRMLASEEQIRRYQAVQSMAPHFQTQEEANMDDATWAAYVQMNEEADEQAIADLTKASLAQVGWLRRARARAEREETKDMESRRREVRKEAEAEVRGRLVYRVQGYLRTGMFRDDAGEEIKVDGPNRLSIAGVETVYQGIPTEESVAAIRATGMAVPAILQPDWRKLGTGRGGMLATEGLDPRMVAETFGYPSADTMIRDLVGAKPMKDAIEERTDALMQERYGEMDSPAAREQRIAMAVHNEARARFIAVELRHISRATEPVRVMLEAARIAAEDIIGGKRLKNINPREHEAAEARAARDAANARRAGGNPAAAAQAAYTRAKNAVLAAPREDTPEALLAATEAAEAAGEAARAASMQKSAAEIQRFTDNYGNVNADLLVIRAKRAQLYQNQLAAEARKATAFVDKQVKYLRKVLRAENRKRMGAEYADQIEALLANVSLVAMSAEQRQRMADLGDWLKKMEADGIKPDISEDLAKAAFRVPYKELTLEQFRELVEAVRTIEYMGKHEQKVLLEKQKAKFNEVKDGIVKRTTAVARSKGRDEKIRRSAQTKAGKAAARFRGFFGSTIKAWAIIEILDGGPGGPLWEYMGRTASERADMETEMNAKATERINEILEPWFRGGSMMGGAPMFPSINRSLTREARLAIALNMGNAGNIQRLLDGEGWTMEQLRPVLETLTSEEWDAVQKVWDFMDEYRPLIAEKERRLYGREPNWVEPQELIVRTVDGQTKTLRGGYYPIVYDPVANMTAQKQSEVEQAQEQLKGAYTAATTRRTFTKERAAKVENRPILYSLQGLWSGVTDVIHDLAWHEWLIDANRLLNSADFDSVVRSRYGDQFLIELKRWIEDNATGNRGMMSAGAVASSYLRQNVSVAGLGYSVRGALMQLTGFSNSIVRVGYGPLLRGISVLATNPREAMRRVNSMSKFMEMRSRTQFRELNEIRNRVRGQRGWQRIMQSHAYTMMLSMQRLVDIPTWLAGYENALAAGKDEATASAMADQDVIATQGSGLLKDLSRIEREQGLAKLFTVFYSYFNTVLNLSTVQAMNARSKGKLAHDMLLVLVIPVMVEQVLKEILTPDDDDVEEKDLQKIAAKLTRAEAEYLIGTLPYLREFQGLSGAIDGEMRGYEGPAGLRGIVTSQRFVQQAMQGEFDRAFRRSSIDLLGVGLGLPSAQINRTIDGLEALSEGETENPLSALMGIQRR
jgi:hypothetical protein